ncbi:MAG: nuclear transport factor 2 family protein [Flavisolibacter sp.]
MDNRTTIEYFYTAFANGDAERMAGCYHGEIEFTDPAFGTLRGADVKMMWRMLTSRNADIRITHDNVHANGNSGSADWQAEYTFTPTGRKVINKISSQFLFQDGKIIKQKDSFDIWKWSRQAFGWKGILLGWTSFMKKKIQTQANRSLSSFKIKQGEKS